MDLKYGILVVSDSVYSGEKEDVSGRLAKSIIEDKGYIVNKYTIIPNDYKLILHKVLDLVKECDVVIVIGGTGPSPRDISIDVIEKISWRTLPGFGEIFRYLTFKRQGFKAIYSRAGLYIVDKSAVIVTPGSPDAVKTALEIVLESIDHVIEEIRRLKGIHRKV